MGFYLFLVVLNFIGAGIVTLWLAYYLITNLQWYNYKIGRVLNNHHSPSSHLFYFLLPLTITLFSPIGGGLISIAVAFRFFKINRQGAKITKRVIRFFTLLHLCYILGIMAISLLGWYFLANHGIKLLYHQKVVITNPFLLSQIQQKGIEGIKPILNQSPLSFTPFKPMTFLPLISVGITLFLSNLLERLLFFRYYKTARKRLAKIDPIVIGITGSYGKTSIKHFLAQILENKKEKIYPTPRSVNTLKGIVKDINCDLPTDTKIYIVEMGARQPGDIWEIVKLVAPHYSILGKVGPQHLDYFKSLERIIFTKMEIFKSPRLKKGFTLQSLSNILNQITGSKDKSILKEEWNNWIISLEGKIEPISATLEGCRWRLKIGNNWEEFFTPILGKFQIYNISLAIYLALEFMDLSEIKQKVANLVPVSHRLQPIKSGDKFIIDDSFNGNLEGVLGSFQLVKGWSGKKVIVTPGLVEAPEEFNRQIAQKINRTFDLAIITGRLNRKIFQKELTIPTIIVENKKELEQVLAQNLPSGSLILFSNDFPEYL